MIPVKCVCVCKILILFCLCFKGKEGKENKESKEKKDKSAEKREKAAEKKEKKEAKEKKEKKSGEYTKDGASRFVLENHQSFIYMQQMFDFCRQFIQAHFLCLIYSYI